MTIIPSARLARAVALPVVLFAAAAVAEDVPPPVPDKIDGRSDIAIEAPHTRVEVDSATGRTRVEAPRTFVAVDPKAGSVRVRVPFVSLDIRW